MSWLPLANMQTLYQYLLTVPVTTSCLCEVDIPNRYLELITGDYGITVTNQLNEYGLVPDTYSALTFHNIAGQRVFGHLTDILDYYWYTDLTKEELVGVFVQLTNLS